MSESGPIDLGALLGERSIQERKQGVCQKMGSFFAWPISIPKEAYDLWKREIRIV